jgi:secondary thiamine-phosphate synthase enzyme
MMRQIEMTIPSMARGFHLITNEIQKKINPLPSTGMLNIFVKHTSCGLTINENCDPSVLIDFETSFNHLIKENEAYYTHTAEGSDDMPAHIKSTLTGASLTIPITNGKLNLGTWQGVYLCEFRTFGTPRTLILTIYS